MKPQLSPIFGNALCTYLNATSEHTIHACQPPENHQVIDQLPRRHQITVRRTASECVLRELNVLSYNKR